MSFLKIRSPITFSYKMNVRASDKLVEHFKFICKISGTRHVDAKIPIKLKEFQIIRCWLVCYWVGLNVGKC